MTGMRPARRTRRAVVTGLATAGLVLLGPTAASADHPPGTGYGSYREQGDDHAVYDVYPWGPELRVCDMERDGHRVYVEYYRPNGSHGLFYDANGSKQGCSVRARRVDSFRVCEEVWGPDWCSWWAYP